MPASEVFSKWKAGELHSGSPRGPRVKSHDQAIAIYLSEKRAEAAHGGKYPEKRQMGGQINNPTNNVIAGHGFGGAPMVPPMGLPPTPPTPPSGMMLQSGLGPQPSAVTPKFQLGGMAGLSPSYLERQSIRNEMHTGPVMSAVPGRTDRHNITVPSGSYVFPAEHVSHLGQNNTMAGMQILSRMFGAGGPYGIGGGGLRHGAGPPRAVAPRMPRMAGLSDRGGGKGDHLGEPVEVEVAGGEYIAPPDAVMRVTGTNDIKHAHNILDHWVMSRRKDHIKTLQKLPPPAKS